MLIEQIKPYENNAKKHTTKQIKQVANSIKEFGFNQPIVVDKDNVIIVGHGRYEASKLLGLTDVPVITVDLTEEQANAYRLADNKLNESEWDMILVNEELKLLSEPMFRLTGFDESIFDDLSIDGEGRYTKKIVPPVYEPRNEKPPLNKLYDDSKTKLLLKKIEKLDLNKDEKDFLKNAAYRMTVFSFKDIADYYAHSDSLMKEIMEELALIIIDYDKAVELGFVNVAENLFDASDEDIEV